MARSCPITRSLTLGQPCRSRALAVTTAALCCALLTLSAYPRPRPLVVWNASASVPVGLYRVTSVRHLKRGDLVLVRLPEDAKRLASLRHYLPSDTPAIKHVAAVGGDHVCTSGNGIYINGVRRADVLTGDSQGRRLPSWTGCETLRSDQILLLNDAPASFDGRYFGPSACGDVIGILTPVWTF